MNAGSSRWVGPTLLCVFALVFFSDVLRGRCFFAADFHETFQPLRLILGEALHRGWPLWDGRMSNGMPLLANPMHAAVYPLNLLFAAFPPRGCSRG